VSDARVSLVIPGRNCAGTLPACLAAVQAIAAAANSTLDEIIFVDDGSTDDSPRIARNHGVRVLTGPSGGPGAARNVGWKAAQNPLIWFIDSDCIARPDALSLLLPHLSDHKVGTVGGSYDNMRPDSLLACLIHEEIALRHRSMSTDVDFLGGFNVIYRREALAQTGGFDEHLFNGPGSPGAEDAELSWRVRNAGYQLRFELSSRVGHYHPTRLVRYLRSQRHHGYWRVFLHMTYRHQALGNDYSGILDHMQPPLALAAMLSAPLWCMPGLMWIPSILVGLLMAAQIPFTAQLVRHTRQLKYLLFAPLGFIRAFARAIGMLQGMVAYPFAKKPPGIRS
jgi:glycosyltransferase involved in cell wall biosynthesis